MEKLSGSKGGSLSGSKWNIGNGRKAKIWTDRWIPTPNSFMVVSLRPKNAENELVETLLDRELGRWNTSAVRNNFLPHEAMTILSIPINQNLPDDSLVWAWMKKGIFTVKSAYHIAHGWLSEGRSLGAGGEESNMQKKKEFWTTI